jgi:site-specific DNA-methyltransferase (cytosine-N4-specific)
MRTLYHGDAWDLAGTLEPDSIDQILTSPPYWSLRCYNAEGQFGLEAHPSEYITKLVDLFERLKPALKSTGSVFINLGDTFFSNPAKGNQGPQAKNEKANFGRGSLPPIREDEWLRPKQLLGIPFRFMAAMQDAGWVLRSIIPWVKHNPLPESVQDRFSCRWEPIFFFVKDAKDYWFDLEAVRRPTVKGAAGSRFDTGKTGDNGQGRVSKKERQESSGANPGDVLQLATKPFTAVDIWGAFKANYIDEEGRRVKIHLIGAPDFRCSIHKKTLKGRDNWAWETLDYDHRPYKESPIEGCLCAVPPDHYALFPPEIPLHFLSAGCAREVCEKCGAPKERITESHLKVQYASRHGGFAAKGNTHGMADMSRNWCPGTKVVETVGWDPTCQCNAPFHPGTCLDPFSGGSTTLCAAKELELRAIGFELSPDYCALSQRRITNWRRPKELVRNENAGQLTMLEEATSV